MAAASNDDPLPDYLNVLSALSHTHTNTHTHAQRGLTRSHRPVWLPCDNFVMTDAGARSPTLSAGTRSGVKV